MAILVGSLLILGVAVLTIPYFRNYCNQTSESPIVVSDKDESTETKNGSKINESELEDRSEKIEGLEKKEQTVIINNEPTLRVKDFLIDTLEKERKKVMRDACVNTETTFEKLKKNVDNVREESEKKMQDESTQTPIIVEALFHNENPGIFIPEPPINNFQSSLNSANSNVSRKSKSLSKRGKGIKNFFNNLKAQSSSSSEKSEKTIKSRSEESESTTSSTTHSTLKNDSWSSNMENMLPLGNSTISGLKPEWGFNIQSNGPLKLCVERNLSSFVSLQDYNSIASADVSNSQKSFNLYFLSPNSTGIE